MRGGAFVVASDLQAGDAVSIDGEWCLLVDCWTQNGFTQVVAERRVGMYLADERVLARKRP